MERKSFHISFLSSVEHHFTSYHFCRGNSNKRKTRLGLIEKGSGTYLYLNKRLDVKEGDVVFVPEKIFCYSEWRGNPEIKVTYIGCFMNYDMDCFEYEPQILSCGAQIWDELLHIHHLLSGDAPDELEAYSLLYRLLKTILPCMKKSSIHTNKQLQEALEFIINRWDSDLSVKDVAKGCCISESKLYHLFQEYLGQTPIQFWNSIKINRAIEYLENSQYSISTISQLAAFPSENHFRKVFRDVTGTTPLKYRNSLL